jgi:hypothetical protein
MKTLNSYYQISEPEEGNNWMKFLILKFLKENSRKLNYI